MLTRNTILDLKLESNTQIPKSYIKFLQKELFQKKIHYSLVFFPRRTKRFALLKSVHVDKKSQEHFEINTFKALLRITTTLNKDKQTFFKILKNKPKNIHMMIRRVV